jgi:hypothetical protein
MSQSPKKPISIKFRFNKESGEIEDLIVDDNMPNASDSFHDQVAELIASQLGAKPLIRDAGPIRFQGDTPPMTDGPGKKTGDKLIKE